MTKELIINHILNLEGGYTNDAEDAGGPTNWGITLSDLRHWRGDDSLTALDVKALSREEAIKIYDAFYWKKMNLDLLNHPAMQLVLFDCGVNRGISASVKQAQTQINLMTGENVLTVDGDLGPKTAAALNTITDDVSYCREFQQTSRNAYVDIVKRKPSQIVFLRGWINRTHATDDLIFTGKPLSIPNEKPDGKPDTEEPVPVDEGLKWIDVAKKELGIHEIKGGENPRIIEYHSHTTGKFDEDEVPWCASFVTWVLDTSGFKSTKNALAMSYATYGEKLNGPKVGCILVFAWGNGGHHVGFCEDYTAEEVQCLGGNQGDSPRSGGAVNYKWYSRKKVVAYRWPVNPAH